MECYFDNSATTLLLDEVVEEMIRDTKEFFGNPSSIHRKGLSASRKLNSSREIVANSIGSKPKEIIFTSGGTESNNLAIKGISKTLGKRGKHIITSMIEHDSIHNTIKSLGENEGYQITYIKPNNLGQINWESIAPHILDDTYLISLMHINNELGWMNDISEIGRELFKLNKGRKIPIHFHVDGIQSYLKIPVNLQDLPGIDSFSISAHKIHGPKGVGALFIREGARILPLIEGGGQEGGLRSGTENTLGIWGFTKAIELQTSEIERNNRYLSSLKKKLEAGLLEALKDIEINSKEGAAPHISNISFYGVKGEILLHTLEKEGIYVSTGSACSSKKKGSRVLEGVNLSKDARDSALRFSFSKFNTMEEIDYAIEVITEKVTELRTIMKYKSRK